MDLTPDDWARLDPLLDATLDLPPREQAAYLDGLGLDDRTRTQIDTLLAADAGGSLIDATDGLRTLVEAAGIGDEATDLKGSQIGTYRVLDEVGRGGMGTVFLAERADGAFEKQVALKVVRSGVQADVLRRFASERHILARLDHPGIARLVDGGETDDGRPFLVMEYVDGEPITTYCDRHALPLDDRLALFVEVCDTVAYAHQRLVVHRDLKPSNVLVAGGSERSGDRGSGSEGEPARSRLPAPRPQVKLLDFGIAKLLDAVEADLTLTSGAPRTPAYAAPEQIRGEPVTTATDVYALGVLLYELLAGRRPFATDGRSRTETERATLQTEARRPSEALADNEVASGPSESHARRLRGDLDAIVLKALRKEPERRYGTAEALGRDLRRHLSGLPVEARPDSVGYRAGRFVRRNRAWATAALLAVVVSMAYVASLRVERDRASAERDRAEASFAYIQSLLAGADPSQRPRADTLLARHLLDVGADGLDGIRDARLAAGLGHAIGRAYYQLGLYADASGALAHADSLLGGIGADTAQATVASLRALAELNRGAADAAESHARRAHRLRAQALGASHPLTLLAQVDVCDALRYRPEPTARNACRDSLTVLARPLVSDGSAPTADRYRLFFALAALAYNVRDLADAQAWGEARAASAGPWSEGALAEGWARHQDGSLANAAGRRRDAIRLYEASLARWRSAYAPDHVLVLYARNNVASMLLQIGEADRAEVLARESVERFDALGPMETVSNAFIAQGLWARALADSGRLGEAEVVYGDFLPRITETWGASNPFRLRYILEYGRALASAGRTDAAAPRIEEAVSGFEAHHPDHFLYGEALVALASLRNDAASDDLARRGLTVLERTLPAGHWRIDQARQQAGL
ncbi:MAG: serine/threonine-protein kinase [Bacteroidota bacterium]